MTPKEKALSEVRIKLGQRHKNGSPRVQAFINDFLENSDPHPFNSRARIFQGTTIELSPDNYEVHLSDIQSLKPQSGAGTKAIKAILKLADKHNVNINAHAKAYASHGNFLKDTEKLVKWYVKMGFRLEDEDVDYFDDGVDIKYYSK
jgi:hypothetical protein